MAGLLAFWLAVYEVHTPKTKLSVVAGLVLRTSQTASPLPFDWRTSARATTPAPLPVEVVYGPDLARPLHPFWATLEEHGEALERLDRQQRGVTYQVYSDEWGPGLIVSLDLARPGDKLRLQIRPKEVRCYLVLQGELLEVPPGEGPIDRGVYLVLAELAARAS